MGKSSDQLREELDAQRSDAGEKIDNLHQQIQGTVEDTRQQVTDTVSQVTESVSHVREEAQAVVNDTVDTVKQAVEEFDITRHVQERPLVTAGAALLGGFVLGALLDSDNNRSGRSSDHSNGSYSPQGSHQSGGSSGFSDTIRSAARNSGLEDTISNAGAALMGAVTDQLKEMVDRSFPGFADKLGATQQQPGSFKEKAAAAQQDAQKN